MTIDEQIEVMQGYKDGKSVQMARKDNTKAEKWVDQDYPVFDFGQYDFRLKPEPETPKYEPFSFDDDLVGKVLIEGGIEFLVIGKSENGLFMNGLFYTFEELLENWKLKDGTPCGKLIN